MPQKADGTLAAVALSRLRGITAASLRHMTECGVAPDRFFAMKRDELRQALDLAPRQMWDDEERDKAVFEARKILAGLQPYPAIEVISLLDSAYPTNLAAADDAPPVIYVLGNTDLQCLHSVALVGTRRATPYGLDFTRRLVADLAAYFPDLLVVSGLALGIDTAAHTAALHAKAPTVAVVAHGLHTVYPSANRTLAREIINAGGALVSEYPLGEAPFRGRFLERNRIIAALASATVVVESDLKGGAMSTARTADSYNRDVMALPGRVNDPTSAGCNHLIRRGKAQLITCAADLMEHTGWKPLGLALEGVQRNLFPELEGDAARIYTELRQQSDPVTLDQLCLRTGLSVGRLMSQLTELEFDGIVARHPGSRFTAL